MATVHLVSRSESPAASEQGEKSTKPRLFTAPSYPAKLKQIICHDDDSLTLYLSDGVVVTTDQFDPPLA